MPRATFILSDGDRRTIDIPAGWSLMEGARQEGIPGIVAECGGGALCSTCHVHVAPEWHETTGPASDLEEALLGLAPGADEHSRLSCQIEMTEAYDGLTVTVPETQATG